MKMKTNLSGPTENSCGQGCDIDRRRFLAASAAGALVASAPSMVFGAPTTTSAAESTIAELFQSLSADQKMAVARSWTDKLRLKVNANWHITKPLIGSDFYTKTQQAMVHKIAKALTSESGYERLKQQTDDDDGGLEAYSMAWFGEPGQSTFEWVLTGRHLTLRADGNCQSLTAFGGPIVYGHSEESSAKANLFYYQTEKVQRVFDSLSTEQRQQALVGSKPPAETKVEIQGSHGKFDGIAVSDLNDESKLLVREALSTILGLYRDEDSSEAMSLIEAHSGLSKLRLAYYSQGDLQNDGVWDIWRIEGPSSVIHFRGAPHVHAYIHVKSQANHS
jgi:hypothetical protein